MTPSRLSMFAWRLLACSNLQGWAGFGRTCAEVVLSCHAGRYQIDVKEAWRGNTQFFTSASGLRFGIAELYRTGLNNIVNFFDIADSRPYNRTRVRIFDVGSGKQVFESQWDPQCCRGEEILPALSPDGHRLALIRKGELQIYGIP
jgi:hypothetical protein